MCSRWTFGPTTFNIASEITCQHVSKIFDPWDSLEEVHLTEDVSDDIVWNLSTSAKYTLALAYLAQFEGTISMAMKPEVWSNWTT
jgi:hypothetical protein